MGRRKKFGEESGFVNVRVPKSKVSEYREAIKKLVDEKFSRDSQELQKEEEEKGDEENSKVIYRDFREFRNDTEEGDKEKIGEENDFVDSVFKEVERLRKKKGDSYDTPKARFTTVAPFKIRLWY